MTIDNDTTQSREDHMIEMGWASPGTLVVQKKTGQLFKIIRSLNVNYAILDEDGKEWRIKFRGVKAAPEDAVFSGPERSARSERRDERREQVAALAEEFSVGDTVEMKTAKDAAKFPGQYLIVKRTAPTRFKLMGIGTGIGLTSPANLIKKA